MSSILDAFPAYGTTRHLDQLRQSEYGFLDEQDHVYLDYTGSGLAARAQHRTHAQRQATLVLGNPHSISPTSALATDLVEQTRARVLRHFSADPDEYAVVFTANATGAARLVGEAYAWQGPTQEKRVKSNQSHESNIGLILTSDNHNSVNGLREFARHAGVRTTYVPSRQPDLHIDTAVLLQALGPLEQPPEAAWPASPRDRFRAILRRATCGMLGGKADKAATGEEAGATPGGGGGESLAAAAAAATAREHGHRRGLFAYPAQSNFSGVRHPLAWIAAAQARGYDVLLDAAAYVPTSQLDLSAYHPDFVLVSWYKLFGYPTGVGCLVARREALARLARPWFSGGTIRAVSVGLDWYAPALRLESQFEDGTVNFQSIPDVHIGLDWLTDKVGLDAVHTRVHCLTAWFLARLLALRHNGTTGAPMIVLYGPDHCAPNGHNRGGTVTFNFVDPAGALVDDRIVATAAAQARISLRTGCFCNPGAGEIALGFSLPELRKLQRLVTHSKPAAAQGHGSSPIGTNETRAPVEEKQPNSRRGVRGSVGSVSSVGSVESVGSNGGGSRNSRGSSTTPMQRRQRLREASSTPKTKARPQTAQSQEEVQPATPATPAEPAPVQNDAEMDNWPIAGAVRVSFGLASNTADVDRFFEFAEQFRDCMADNSGLGPRADC